MKIKISKLLNNKRARYFVVISVLVLFCLVLNIAFSAFTHTASGVAANLSLRNMTYNVTIDSEAGAIVKVSANTVLKLNTKFVATNNIKSNYELSYDVCSDATCSSTLTKPSTLTVQYSSRTTDPFKGQIDATGTKNIRVVITNDGSELYIRLRMNSGYYYNTLQLEKKITSVYNEDDLTVYAYVNGAEVDSFPTTSDYSASVFCHKDGSTTAANATGTATYSNGQWVVNVSGVDAGRTVCDVKFGFRKDFAYNGTNGRDGSVQTLSITNAGNYKLEVWGAQGGYRSSAIRGGYGGYSVGTVSLKAGDKLYVYVGGFGGNGTSGCGSTICAGGYNGGGYRYKYYGGGGGTDIRINSTSLYARVIVAGGGGSDGATSKTGMYGGGTTGGSSAENYSSIGNYGGKGGNQTYSGYSAAYTVASQATTGLNSNNVSYYGGGFGFGGGGVYVNSGYGGAGGGGWYGGSGNVPDGSGDDDRGGGGGSGYVYTSSTAANYPSGCLLSSTYYLSNASTVAGSTSFTSPTGTAETGHTGHGYARVTYVS